MLDLLAAPPALLCCWIYREEPRTTEIRREEKEERALLLLGHRDPPHVIRIQLYPACRHLEDLRWGRRARPPLGWRKGAANVARVGKGHRHHCLGGGEAPLPLPRGWVGELLPLLGWEIGASNNAA